MGSTKGIKEINVIDPTFPPKLRRKWGRGSRGSRGSKNHEKVIVACRLIPGNAGLFRQAFQLRTPPNNERAQSVPL